MVKIIKFLFFAQKVSSGMGALRPKFFMNKKCFFFQFYILFENFIKIGPIMKKIPKFWSDPLKLEMKT